ncbi:hypothetical protein KP509_04G071400 [Ceratopteris richardii]|uniref:BHLH domain-containing protein n=1 Tax=Ceratopteris richardii TaxID=49495 RepID=A0A8T2V118_CERRI|nr:hypothetical protein KP509_04G071400 [Ceratopteris richardii]
MEEISFGLETSSGSKYLDHAVASAEDDHSISCMDDSAIMNTMARNSHVKEEIETPSEGGSLCSNMAIDEDELNCLFEFLDNSDPSLESSYWRCSPQKPTNDANLNENTVQPMNLGISKQCKSLDEETIFCKSNSLPFNGATNEGSSSGSMNAIRQDAPGRPSDSFPDNHPSNPSFSGNSEGENILPGKTSLSRSLVLERRRRRTLNEKLYSLRALVPNISKMDKASIVSDAIKYIRDLQGQVESMGAEVHDLGCLMKDDPQEVSCIMIDDRLALKRVIKNSRMKHQILELEVADMEERTFQLRLHCKNGQDALVKLSKAMEALKLEILNANLTVMNDHMLSSLVVKTSIGKLVTKDELKQLILSIIPQFDFTF